MIAVGSDVEWVYQDIRISSRGTRIKASKRRGMVESIHEGVATVKMRNGRRSRISLSSLQKFGDGPCQLVQLMNVLAGKEPE